MKRERALVASRRNQIVELMKENPEVRVDQLAEILEVSPITIRRDLQHLEEQNMLVRFYGGARKNQIDQEMSEIQIYRNLIARFASKFVSDGDTLFINTSRNAMRMVEYIQADNVTVITNNGKAIAYEQGNGVNVVITGGELRYPKYAMVGDFAIRNLQTVYAKKTFLGCSGISPDAGMTTEIFNEVSINELMVDHTIQEVYILADHTKIGKNSSFTSCTIDKINGLITDEKAPKEVLEQLRAQGVLVYQVYKDDFKY